MKFRTYKVKQGQYGGVIDSTITLPDELKLITGGENDLGERIHKGNSHYLGILRGDIDEIYNGIKGLHTSVKECGEYIIITIHDIKFIDEYPYLVTADELNSEFDLTKYYLVNWSYNLNLMNMKKIIKINSEFNIDVLEVTNRDYLNVGPMTKLEVDTEELDIVLNNGMSYSDYAPLATKVVTGEIAKLYWNTLIHNIVDKFGISIDTKLVDLTAANRLLSERAFDKLDDYINMKIAEYT